MLNKIKGGLFGVAVGDALGCAVEFMTPEEIQSTYGKITEIMGGGPFFFEKGDVTDDTQMSLCVARGIVQQPGQPIKAIGDEFMKWIKSKPNDVGTTIRYSLSNYSVTKDWEEASELTHHQLNGHTAGNGTIMRTLPVALAYGDVRKMQKITLAQSKLTHWHQKAGEACLVYNRIAYRLLQGEELKNAIFAEAEGTPYDFALHYEPAGNPDGYVHNTLEWALYLLLNTSSYEEAVVRAVNEGYDTDTTAAVVGGLAGIYYGFNEIPTRYVNALHIKKDLHEMAEKLYDVRLKESNTSENA